MDELQQSLAGMIPSYYDKNTNTYSYSTNYGTIEIDGATKQVKSCCIGFSDYSIQHANKRVVIRILGDEFSIRTGTIFKENTEMASKGYPHKLSHSDTPKITEVFDVLSNIKDMTQGIMAVFIKLIHLMEANGKVTENSYAIKELRRNMMLYSRYILRHPVVTRKPIVTKS